MTDAQTEARAIIAGRRLAFDNESGPQALIEAIATALSERDATISAKDAELAGWKKTATEYANELHTLRAQLAEGNKALEPFAAYAEARDSVDAELTNDVVVTAYVAEFRGPSVKVTLGDFRAARRAREQGGENNG